MLEIFVETPKDDLGTARLKGDVEKLCRNGWVKFGNNGFVILFKDVPLEKGKAELDYLGVNKLEVEEWVEK